MCLTAMTDLGGRLETNRQCSQVRLEVFAYRCMLCFDRLNFDEFIPEGLWLV